MPLCADPNDLIPYVLETDRDGPEPRPTFRLRALSELESRQVSRLIQDANDAAQAKGEEQAVAKLNEAIAVGLRGYVGPNCAGKPVTADRPANEYLTSAELWELAFAVLNGPRLDEEKKRASASSVPSGKGPSVQSVSAEGVTTVPPSENPPSSPA